MAKPKFIENLDDVFDTDPVGLSYDDLSTISGLVGRNVRTKEDLFAAIKTLATISVEGIDVTFDPGLLTRIKSRCIRQDFPKFLHDRVLEWAHNYVGW